MSEEPRSFQSQGVSGPEWLLEPPPSGVRLQLTTVAESKELTPEVIQALHTILEQLQKQRAQQPRAIAEAGCPQLASCREYSGDCNRLRNCGNYRPLSEIEPIPLPP
jgi:hypothetical protein